MPVKFSEKSSSGTQIHSNNTRKLIKTGFLFLTWTVLSIHAELVGPTMPILAANVNVDYNGMGSVLASRGVGYLAVNVLGAMLQTIVKNHSDGLLICAFLLPAIVVFVTPLVTSLALLCGLFFFHGIGQGMADLAGTNVLLTMWGENAAAPLNIVQLGYGVGAIAVNLLVRPFLTEKVLSTNSIISRPDITTPYTITAVLCLSIAVGYIFFYITELKNRKVKLEVEKVDYTVVNTNVERDPPSSYSPRTCGRGYFQYGLILSTTFILSIFFIGGNEQTFSKFFFTFLQFERFNLSTNAASWAILSFWISFSIGRLMTAIISLFVSVTVCLNIVWLAALCLAIAWLILVWIVGLTGTSLLILGVVSGVVFAPIIPLTYALFNQRLTVVPLLLALVLCGGALGTITFQKLAGFVMDYNPNHFPTLLVICVVVSISLYVTANLVYAAHQRRRASRTSGAVFPSEDYNGEEEQHIVDYSKA